MIKLYSNNCPTCLAVKKVLKAKEIDFEEENDYGLIMELAQREQMMDMPFLEIEGLFYTGKKAVEKAKEL